MDISKDSSFYRKTDSTTVSVLTHMRTEHDPSLTDYMKALSDFVWPVVVVFLALKFRSEIVGLLKRITKAKVSNTEFEFENSVNNAAEEIKELRAVKPV
ncbi:MAG: hypothetical protein Q8916_01530 [Bacteroidota bacterium]|nr:hypothetical protein [Bacteroidota bacterium]MDP4229067.1 hypothetical protein [Bacteroidota bacterium]MDP4237276.1 hypothetical protein [Bacteroidota bacterium]